MRFLHRNCHLSYETFRFRELFMDPRTSWSLSISPPRGAVPVRQAALFSRVRSHFMLILIVFYSGKMIAPVVDQLYVVCPSGPFARHGTAQLPPLSRFVKPNFLIGSSTILCFRSYMYNGSVFLKVDVDKCPVRPVALLHILPGKRTLLIASEINTHCFSI